MARAFKAPSNPKLFGHLIAALRVQSKQRAPANETERQIREKIELQHLDPAIAKRLLGNFDKIPEDQRKDLLGPIAVEDFVPVEASSGPVIGTSASAHLASSHPLAGTHAPTGTHAGGTTAALGVASGSVHGSTNLAVEPLPVYTIRYQGLWCQEETTWDGGSNSDEPYLITTSVHIEGDGSNVVRTERHPVGTDAYDDVDDHEERIGPVAAAWHGNSDPVSVTVVMMEHDYGDPDYYRDEVDYLVKASIAIASKFFPPVAILEAVSSTITDALNWLLGTEDDLISTETVVLPRGQLETYAVAPHSFYVAQENSSQPTSTHLMYHFLTEHRGEGADYVVGFDVVRDPSLPPNEVIV